MPNTAQTCQLRLNVLVWVAPWVWLPAFKCMKHCVSGLKSPVSWTVHRDKVAKKCLENRARPCCGELPSLCMKGKGPAGYSWEFLVGVYCPVLQILTLLQTKKCYFPHPFSVQTSKMHRQALKTPFLGFWLIQTGYWPVPFSLHEALQIGGLFHQGQFPCCMLDMEQDFNLERFCTIIKNTPGWSNSIYF